MDNKKEFEIIRTFNAPLSLVWDAHTKVEHMSKWWGPKGFKKLKCTLDLRPGGVFLYGMESPDGLKMWGKFVYREIVPKTKLVFVDSFSDENAGITRHPFAPGWPAEILNIVTFSEKDGKTTLTLKAYPINALESESKMFISNMQSLNKGFGGTYDQLEEFLLSHK